MEAVGAAASVATLAKLAFGLVQYTTAVKDASRDIARFYKSLESLQNVLERARLLLERPDAAAKLPAYRDLSDALKECQSQLGQLLEKLQKKLPKPGSKRAKFGLNSLLWPLKAKEMKDHVERIERWKTTINAALQLDQTSALLDLGQKIDLSKLPIAGGAIFDSRADEYERGCLNGTRVDLLQKVGRWAKSPHGELIFWLNGMAGTGKSTISRTVAQIFSDKNELAASFFFKRGEGHRGDATRLFTTIATQLASTIPSLAAHIGEAVDLDPQISEKRITQQFEQLILKPMAQAQGNLWTWPKMVVIDALDECDREDDVRTVLRLLARVKELPTPTLRFFVTSRPERPPRLGFNAMPGGWYEDLVLEEVAPLTIEHDISLFLEHEFAQIREEHNLSRDQPLPEDWPEPQDIQQLVNTAVPLFISAATMCMFIKDRRFDPKVRLKKVLSYGNLSYASRFDKTYRPVLDQLLVDLSEADERSLLADFKLVVGSIVLFAQPLSKTSMTSLLGLTEGTVDRILDWLHSVLYVPTSNDSPVRMLHLSFREFLVDPEKCEYPFWIDQKAQHRMLAAECLELMSQHHYFKNNICSLPSPGSLRADVDSQTIESCLPPELQYACCYWVYHLKEGGERISDGGRVHQFLKTHFLHWVEALCLLDNISDSIAMVIELRELIECDASAELSDFLSDARRFLLSNRIIIDKTPLQIYSSALVFAPQKCGIRNCFRDQIPSWISCFPATESHWGPEIQSFVCSDDVFFIRFSEDSRLLLTVDYHSIVKLWDTTTGRLLQSLKIEAWDDVDCSADLRFLATVRDKCVRVRDMTTAERVQDFSSPTDKVYGVAFSPSNVLAARHESSVELWDIHAGVKRGAISVEPTIPTAWSERLRRPIDGSVISFSSDGNYLAAEIGGAISVWDLSKEEPKHVLETSSTSASNFAFSPDSDLLAIIWNWAIEIWRPATGQLVRSLQADFTFVRALVYSADDRLVACGDGDGEIIIAVYDAELVQSWRRCDEWPGRVALPKRGVLAISLVDSIELIDCASGKVLSRLLGDFGTVSHVYFGDFVTSHVFSGDGNLLAAVSGARVMVWDVTLVIPPESSSRKNNAMTKVAAISGDGSLLVTAVRNGTADSETLTLWDRSQREPVKQWTAQVSDTDGPIGALTISGNNRFVASGHADGTVTLRDVTTGEMTGPESLQADEHEDRIHGLVFSHNCKLLAVASGSGLYLCDLPAGEICCLEAARPGGGGPLAFSEDDGFLAMERTSGPGIAVYDTATRKAPIDLHPPNKFGMISFSKDCQHVVAVAYNEDVRASEPKLEMYLWNATTGAHLRTIGLADCGRGSPSHVGDTHSVAMTLGLLRVPASSQGTPAPNTLQHAFKLVFLDPWIIRDGQKLLCIPDSYGPKYDFNGYGVSFGGNTFAWVNQAGLPIVIGFVCE